MLPRNNRARQQSNILLWSSSLNGLFSGVGNVQSESNKKGLPQGSKILDYEANNVRVVWQED